MQGFVNKELVVVRKRKTAVANVVYDLQNIRFSNNWKNVKMYTLCVGRSIFEQFENERRPRKIDFSNGQRNAAG